MPDSYTLLPFPALPSCKLHTPADYGYFDESQVYGYARTYALANLVQLTTELEALRKRCEAVEALVPLWRDEGIRLNGGADKPYTDAENSIRAFTLGCCSDDLARAIAAAQEPSHG